MAELGPNVTDDPFPQPVASLGWLVERQRRRPAAGHMGRAGGREIVALAGAIDALVVRGRDLLDGGNAQMACHVAEWATRSNPEHQAAQELTRYAYKVRLDAARETMTQGIYRAAMNDANQALGVEPEAPGRLRI